jgi:hypothetical protein
MVLTVSVAQFTDHTPEKNLTSTVGCETSELRRHFTYLRVSEKVIILMDGSSQRPMKNFTMPREDIEASDSNTTHVPQTLLSL